MEFENITQYYSDLMRLASARCGSMQDAEDLVSETMLAALVFLRRGGEIRYPRTWLANTLMNRYSDRLRRRYRQPVIVNWEDCMERAGDEDELPDAEEYAALRREVSMLGRLVREVTVRYYFRRQSVAEIARELGVPQGTVKSRLHAGRREIRKGIETMDTVKNHLPWQLWLSFGGSEGCGGAPRSLVENDLIAQNLLLLAYDVPHTAQELARAIGIPTAYIEPILARLEAGELMARAGERYYTDFVIYREEDSLSLFDAQLAFVHRHFDTLWGAMEELLAALAGSDAYSAMTAHQRRKLERYAILKSLQDFTFDGTGVRGALRFPARRDGGYWCANATAIPPGGRSAAARRANEYVVQGGHRSSRAESALDGGTQLRYCEFDTTLWDNPHRYSMFDGYFRWTPELLYGLWRGVPADELDVPPGVIEAVPRLAARGAGLLTATDDGYAVDIPVLSAEEYGDAERLMNAATGRLLDSLGGAYTEFLSGHKLPLPPHLKSVPDLFRYTPATKYLVMGTVREAYGRGLHLRDVNYCCPPLVLVYRRGANN